MAERAEHAETAPAVAPAQAPAVPATLGDLVSLGGPTTPGVVLKMQERVGNRATTVWLSRQGPATQTTTGPRDVLIQMAATFIDNPVHYKLTMHYGYGGGAPMRLTGQDVMDMNVRMSVLGWDPVSAAIREADAELRARYRDPEREQAGFPPVIPVDAEPVRRHVTTSGPAIANGSLANCRAHIDGDVIVDRVGARFEGSVHFTDYWDFDPKLWQTIQGTSGRTWMGEIQTIIGWAALPGQPFDVTTDTVNVVQEPGFGHARLSR